MSDIRCPNCGFLFSEAEKPTVSREKIGRWARFIWLSIPPGSVDVNRVNETQDNFIEQLKSILTELGITPSDTPRTPDHKPDQPPGQYRPNR